jgi:hypothetical protein
MRVPPGSQLVFNQIVTSKAGGGLGTLLNSDPKFNDWLGRPNELRLFAVVDRISADGVAGVIELRVQDAGDEEIAWATSFYYSPSFQGPGTTVFAVADTVAARNARPSLGFRRLSVGYNVDNVNPQSARVRIWATGRNGYRKFNRLMLDERVDGNVLYTPQQACAWLAGADDIAWMVLTDDVVGTPPITLTLLLEDGPNGRVWEQIPVGPDTVTSGTVLVCDARSG